MNIKVLFVLGVGLVAGSCSNSEQKQPVQDTTVAIHVATDSAAPVAPKHELSITDSVKQLAEKDTASKMIENAPASVSIHLDSIP